MQTITQSTAPKAPTHREILHKQMESWNRFSPAWERWDDFTMRFLEPQGAAIRDALDIDDVAEVLDIASGTGDPGLTLATTKRGVRVTALDSSEGMLAVARRKASARGLENFRTVVGDACELDFADASFDAVSCRLGFMFFPDMAVAAREMARVVRPGGVVATTVWGPPQDNRWITTAIAAVKKHLDLPTPPAGSPGLFRCATPGTVPALFESAGLSVERDVVLSGSVRFGSSEEYWRFMTEVVPPIVAAKQRATPEQVEGIRAEIFAALESGGALSDGLSWATQLVVARR